jgi:S1-C subfamily serine protease
MQKYGRLKDWLLPVLIGLAIGLLYYLFFLPKNVQQSARNLPALHSYANAIESITPFSVSILSNSTSTAAMPFTDEIIQKYLTEEASAQTNLGSGIILNQSGDIVTNAHVLGSARDIIVVTSNNQVAQVQEIFIDPETDIALLKTNLKTSQDLPISRGRAIRTGDLVFTIGNPFGIGQSVSMGIVSATGRSQPGLTQLTDFIQTDAAINPGNSGGILMNSFGEVIGMNSAIFSSTGGYQGIGFAIPMAQVLSVVEELQLSGTVTRGYLGIDVSELSVSTDLAQWPIGLEIISIAQNSPAALSGLKTGDLLLAINGNPIISRNKTAREISRLMPGKTTDVRILRGKKIERYDIVLGVRP